MNRDDRVDPPQLRKDFGVRGHRQKSTTKPNGHSLYLHTDAARSLWIAILRAWTSAWKEAVAWHLHYAALKPVLGPLAPRNQSRPF